MTLEELKHLHPGHVLIRISDHKRRTKRLRIVRARTLFQCDHCGVESKDELMAKWERGGNATMLVICLPCTVQELSPSPE